MGFLAILYGKETHHAIFILIWILINHAEEAQGCLPLLKSKEEI